MKALPILGFFVLAVALVAIVALPSLLSPQNPAPSITNSPTSTPEASLGSDSTMVEGSIQTTSTPLPTQSPTATQLPTATPVPTQIPTATQTAPALGSKENPVMDFPFDGQAITVELLDTSSVTPTVLVNGVWYKPAGIQGVIPFAYEGVTGQKWLKPSEMQMPFTGVVSIYNGFATITVPYTPTQKDEQILQKWANSKDAVQKAAGWVWDSSPFGMCVSRTSVWRALGWSIPTLQGELTTCWGKYALEQLPVRVMADDGTTDMSIIRTPKGSYLVEIMPRLREGGIIFYPLAVNFDQPHMILADGLGLRNWKIEDGQTSGELFVVQTGETFPFVLKSSQGYIKIRTLGKEFISLAMIYTR